MRKVPATCLSLAAAWSLLLLVGAATVPVYSGESTTVAGDGSQTTMSTSATLLQENGAWVLVLLSVPAVAVLLTAGLLAIEPRHRWAVWAAWGPTGLVGIIAVLGMMTIGVFLLPVAVLLGISTLTVTLDPASTSKPVSGLPPTAPR